MVEQDHRMKTYFPKVPRPTFKRGTNIKELLCRAKLPPIKKSIATRTQGEQYRNGVVQCSKGKSKGGCTACSIITSRPAEIVREVTIYNTGEKIPIKGRMDCKTRGFLYLVWSNKDPRVQYLGRCSRQVSDRLGEHWRDVMNNKKGKAVAEHFHRLKSKVGDFRFMPFLKI